MSRHRRDWIELVTEMLWVFERETKLTLRCINEEFKFNGLSFDSDFRNHFLQIIMKRVSKTYDQFQMRLRFEEMEYRCEPDAMDSDTSFGWKFAIRHNDAPRPFAAQKRRLHDSCDVGNKTFSIKRPRIDDESDVCITLVEETSVDDVNPSADDYDSASESMGDTAIRVNWPESTAVTPIPTNIDDRDDQSHMEHLVTTSTVANSLNINEPPLAVSSNAAKPTGIKSSKRNGAPKWKKSKTLSIETDDTQEVTSSGSRSNTPTNDNIASGEGGKVTEKVADDGSHEQETLKDATSAVDNDSESTEALPKSKNKGRKSTSRKSDRVIRIPVRYSVKHSNSRSKKKDEPIISTSQVADQSTNPIDSTLDPSSIPVATSTPALKGADDHPNLLKYLKLKLARASGTSEQSSSLVAIAANITETPTKSDVTPTTMGADTSTAKSAGMPTLVTVHGVTVFKCDQCEYTNARKFNIMRHMAIHTEKPLQCEVCSKRFSDQNKFDRHQQMHVGKCKYCRKQITDASKLEAHQKKCTSKQFECYMCPFKTPSLVKLTTHMCKHTGKNPFACELCPNAFASEFSLHRHMLLIHNLVKKK